MWKALKAWLTARKLEQTIAKAELEAVFKALPSIVREAHETYKIGDFTATIVGSKADLDTKMLINRVNADKRRSLKRNEIDDLALKNLVKVSDD